MFNMEFLVSTYGDIADHNLKPYTLLLQSLWAAMVAPEGHGVVYEQTQWKYIR